MNKLKLSLLALLSCLLAPSCQSGGKTDTAVGGALAGRAVLVVSSEKGNFARNDIFASPKAAPDVMIDTTTEKQTMEGFGGAFNEQGWAALLTLPEAKREEVLKQIFDPTDGLRFNIGRVPIGASDYALDRYTLSEVADDFSMDHFSLERDEKLLLPYIKAAMKYRPDLKVWGSAWTPPKWMKTNGDYDKGAMRDEPEIYEAYALYLAKFVEGYRARGIDLYMVVPQNEPGQLENYPSCDWSAAQFRTFIRDYLGPLFRDRKVPAEIWLGTLNTGNFYAHTNTVLSDPATAAFVSGAAFQWDGLFQVNSIRTKYPALKIMQSETDCGNWHWKPGFNKDKAQNDFTYAAYTWRKFKAFIADGCSSYLLWNIVLDETGKNLNSVLPWPQNSAIVVDRTNGQVAYTPLFWATKHFSALVDPGARLLGSGGADRDVIAFQNPDGEIAVELLNDGAAVKTVKVDIGGRVYECELPARSFATLLASGDSK